MRYLIPLVILILVVLVAAPGVAVSQTSVEQHDLPKATSEAQNPAPPQDVPAPIPTPVPLQPNIQPKEETPQVSPSGEAAPASAPSPAIPVPTPLQAPEDPCLPGLYKDWQEMSVDVQENPEKDTFYVCRIVIDRSRFHLTIEGIKKNGTVQEIYETPVGLGDVNSRTPEGSFVINHVYCYPDVLFFDSSGEKVPGLYSSFFAPLLLCHDNGRCDRFRELGIHGFHGAAARMHHVPVSSTSTYGAVSGGCIRVPDPCRLKWELIRLVGIGPVKKNDRGTYHWLSRPVEVVITGKYPGTEEEMTLATLFQQSVEQVHDGLMNFFGIFGR
ncbi:MAG TPA: L,D-transpeptidase family protein [Desulfomonilaceae bacterium]|nr:L,D-transpeptidase family protein [Desulfomonilaceae bacterium]